MTSADSPPPLDPLVERRNIRLFVGIQLLTYFAAPVLYVGVVQAAFCDLLGASATIANLPHATYLLGAAAPLVAAWLIPAALEQRALRLAYLTIAFSFLFVVAAVFLPVSNGIRIGVVIGQGLLLGMLASTVIMFLFRCLARGTSETGRARALRYAFGLGPIAAVVGSLFAQRLLAGGIAGIVPPANFAVLYLVALPCILTCAYLAGRMQLPPAIHVPAQPLGGFLRETAGGFVRDRRLLLAWIAYFLWYCTLGGLTTLSLYTREAVGRTPFELAGVIMALRFGSKALAGFALGGIALKFGARAALGTAVTLLGLALTWPLVSTGYGYLLAFGLAGAGELGAVYFTNYVIAVSPPTQTTRNLAFLALVSPASSIAPALHGRLADGFGYPASFVFGGVTAMAALLLLLGTRRAPQLSPA